MNFANRTLSDFNDIRSLEWIETNGLGGYASSTVSGAHSRRYHGMLVAALHPPGGRHVLLSKLDETIVVQSDNGMERRLELSANQYPHTIHPKGYIYLDRFERDLFPVFYFRADGIELKKTVAAIQGENTTLVLYEVVVAPTPFTLELLPLSSSRDFNSLCRANQNIGSQFLFEDGIFRTLNYHDGTELFIGVPGAEFSERQEWYYHFEYTVEQFRGMDFQEDLYTHGSFLVELRQGDSLGIIISTEDPQGRDAFKLFAEEKSRREESVKGINNHAALRRLLLAADQFIVKRGIRKTIIAGYHWFTDWGRDTMISLPGLCLSTGRYKEAKEILTQFSESVSEGMLPNRFVDDGQVPEYNTIDATLWFFHAIHQYYLSTDDKAFAKSMGSVLKEIISWHYKGTRYGIKVDSSDELLQGGQEGMQLTWMDAKVGDWVVTPRTGKPVEINALWYNALCIMEVLTREFGKEADANDYREKARKVLKSFNAQFWNKKEGCLYDYIDGDAKNADLRPNQLYAICLPFPLLSKEPARKVLECVKNRLLTPRGLRSLDRSHPAYKPVYAGTIWERDGAYHQGTVWSFLLGPYVDALIQVKGKKGAPEAAVIAKEFVKHLDEAGVSSVSEIFDGEEPHLPRGCIAQAWGVAEVLRVILKYNLMPREDAD